MGSAAELTRNWGKIPLVLVNGEASHDLGADAVEEVGNSSNKGQIFLADTQYPKSG
jgi:hypothetical protein